VLALLVPCGRHGDVHPSLAPGRAPRPRGRRVTLLINGDFGPHVRRLGFAVAPPGEASHFEQALRNPTSGTRSGASPSWPAPPSSTPGWPTLAVERTVRGQPSGTERGVA
jgi:hypothetical protein